jgi:hypothetical protein
VAEVDVVKQKSRYTKARKIFLALFLLSGCMALILYLFTYLQFHANAPAAAPAPGGIVPVTGSGPDLLTIVTLAGTSASCLTAIVSLAGLVLTTILMVRKEAREKADNELERKHKEIQLEKERLELERIRTEQEKRP